MAQPRGDGEIQYPLVSVVVPTHNRRDLLERCLSALAAQDYSNFEVIVIDDGSTDDTPDFLRRFADQHSGLALRTLRQERCLGANPSRNRGIRDARGEFVAFEDNDCIARPDWLTRLVRGFTGDRVAAVVGLVEDVPPTNIFELTFKGTHRLGGTSSAHRLIAGNMCVRRDLLLRFMLDEDRATATTAPGGAGDPGVSGRGDEEGLYLMLRADGYDVRAAPDAVVLHDHHYSARSFFKQAFRGGRSAARLVYKYHLWPRIDMLPFAVAYLTLPLVFWDRRLGVVPLLFFAAALAAVLYNDLFRKGKSVIETLATIPVLIVYYHVRLVGYGLETVRLRLRRHDMERKDLRRSRKR